MIEDRKPAHEYIEETLTVLIKSSDVSNARLLQNTLDEISSLWKEVTTLSSKQTTRFDNALKMAEKFDALVTELEFWLTRIEGSISLFEAVSTILENIEKQKQQFKVSQVKKFVILRLIKCVYELSIRFDSFLFADFLLSQ